MTRKQAREPNYCSDYNTSHLLKSGKLRKETKYYHTTGFYLGRIVLPRKNFPR